MLKRKILIIILLLFLNISANALVCTYASGKAKIDAEEYEATGIRLDSSSDGIGVELVGGSNIHSAYDNFEFVGKEEEKDKIEYALQNGRCPDSVYFYIENRYLYITIDNSLYNSNVGSSTIKGSYKNSSSQKSNRSGIIGNICEGTKEFKTFFKETVNKPLKILSVILFIILTAVEYVKAIFVQSVEIKKANSRTVKRFIALIIIFFAQEIINLITIILGMTVCGN